MREIMEYLWLLAIPAMSWLDRQRGMPKDKETIPKLPALLGIGYLCAVLTGHWFDWQTLAIVAGVAVLHNISFGEPMGHALTGIGGATADDGTTYEVWQFNDLLKRNPWLALALRGVFVGGAGLVSPVVFALAWFVTFPFSETAAAPILTLLEATDWTAAPKIALAFGVAFPLAAFIARRYFNGNCGTNERTRGALIGTILLTGGMYA